MEMDALAPANLLNFNFGLFVSPYMFSARQTYILQPLADTSPAQIAETTKFVLKNGDEFEGYFIPSKRCFVGLRSLFRRYRDLNIHFLSFEYHGAGVFFVAAFDTAAVEVVYPTDVVNIKRPELKYERIPEMDAYRFSEVYSMQDQLNNTLFRVNARDCGGMKITIYMPQQCEEVGEDSVLLDDIDSSITELWKPRDRIFLEVGNKFWKVSVKKVGDSWSFYRGWPRFVSDVGVEDSDLIVLYSSSNPFRFDVGVHKFYAGCPKCVESGVGVPRKFVKTVTEEVLEKGELIIPCLYIEKYDNVLATELSVVAPNGSVYHALFSLDDQKIYGLQELIADSIIHAGYTLVFSQASNSALYLSIYDEKLLAIVW